MSFGLRPAAPALILFVGTGGHVRTDTHRYHTTIDRAGYALAAGAGLGGVAMALLSVAGGETNPLNLLVSLGGGSLIAAVAIVAVAAPIWLSLHLAGWRHPLLAALLGGLIALLICIAGLTYGFGLGDVPPMDARALWYRWLSAAATSALVALIAAAIGLAMWRIAYRRVLDDR